MPLYNEEEAVAKIKALPFEVKCHLSHVVRNGLCLVHAAHHCKGDIENSLQEFERRWKELGL